MEPKKRQKKSLEEQEAILLRRMEILEQQKKRLVSMKDKKRTKRLILLGTLLEKSLEKAPQNKAHFSKMAESIYAKRPSDLAILREYLGS